MRGAVRGHAAALHLLERAVALDRVAHAYAFVGPSGIGKRLTALAFAQTLLCPSLPLALSSPPQGGEDKGEGVANRGLGGCGTCSACRRVASGAHPDCRPIAPDGQTIKIEQIRELGRLAALTPHEGRRKVFIIDEAERMPPVTANALLKTLEEPPDRTVLVLILSQARALPPTVLSRCQVVRFAPLPDVEAVAVLEDHGVDAATASFLARACQGRVGLVLAADARAWRERRDGALAVLQRVGAEGGLLDSAEALGRDRSQVQEFIEAAWLWYRDLLCAKAGADPRLLLSTDREAELSRAGASIPWEAIFAGLGACREAWQALQGNVSPRLTLEVLLGRLVLKAA